MERVIIKIDGKLVAELQGYLDEVDMDFHSMKLPEDSTLETFTARFSNGYEADIKVCSGQNNCFIDPVMFNQNGFEIALLDVESDLLGEYTFEVEGKDYTVELVEK